MGQLEPPPDLAVGPAQAVDLGLPVPVADEGDHVPVVPERLVA
jgi:hypothetical protein